jgi:O-methyltransferase
VQVIKNAVRGIAAQLGLEISRKPSPVDATGPAENVRPFATYAPWRQDVPFQNAYTKVRGNTMVDIYRLYELWMLVEQVAHLSGDIVEIGVWRGGSGSLMGLRAQQLGLDAKVYLCDTFRGMVKTSERDPLYKGGELSDTSAAIVESLARDTLKLQNVEILPGIFPDETGHRVSSSQVRLCHIDVDVYRSAEDIVSWVWPKLPIGGLLVYDDYGFPTCAGIADHVNEQRGLADRIVIHNLNGHAIVVKIR